MSFKVINPGFLSTVQDYGRLNHSEHGLSQSGVMDEHAYCWGNYLLDNYFDSAVIEITFGALVLEAQVDTFIAVTGADLGFKINGNSVAMWCTLKIHKGDNISWGNAKYGLRAYLAVKGGFDTQIWFDSRSVNLREQIGSKLNKGDILPCKHFDKVKYQVTSPKYRADDNQNLILRLLPSYQFNDFSAEQQNVIFNQAYTIGNASDRVGCRLDGIAITGNNQTMISEPMAYGSVEIATDGLPIILLKDAPSIGGYPKIGSVFSLDLAKLAQQRPGSNLRFKLMNIQSAQHKRGEFNQFFGINF